jgi:hypothetical protein
MAGRIGPDEVFTLETYVVGAGAKMRTYTTLVRYDDPVRQEYRRLVGLSRQHHVPEGGSRRRAGCAPTSQRYNFRN